MRLKKFLIAGGNSTLLAWGCTSGEKNKIIKKYLGKVEQIGFVETKNNLPFLNMMGGELCINGTIALAKTLGNKGSLYTSGCFKRISYKNYKKSTSIKLKIPYRKRSNIVVLSGIGYILVREKEIITKKLLSNFCRRYKLPAFGAIIFKNSTLFPYVYVQNTKSLVQETACGSGSVALNILKKITKINQTTGKQIVVTNNKSKFSIDAEVTKQ